MWRLRRLRSSQASLQEPQRRLLRRRHLRWNQVHGVQVRRVPERLQGYSVIERTSRTESGIQVSMRCTNWTFSNSFYFWNWERFCRIKLSCVSCLKKLNYNFKEDQNVFNFNHYSNQNSVSSPLINPIKHFNLCPFIPRQIMRTLCFFGIIHSKTMIYFLKNKFIIQIHCKLFTRVL